MALSATTIDAALMGLTISGVTCHALSAVPITVGARDCPTIFPDPEGWGGDMSAGVQSFSVAGGYWEVTRTLYYIYLHQLAGSGRNAYETLSAMSDKRDAIIEQIVELEIAGVDITGITSTSLTVMIGPDTMSYNGFRLGVQVRERINA